MKIRIEGCTAEELAEYSPHLSLGKEYSGEDYDGYGDLFWIIDDENERTVIRFPNCCHLPQGAKWVEVTE